MRVLALLVAAFAAVSFPIYLVVFTLRFLLMLILAPIVGLIFGASWKLRERQSRKNTKTIVIRR